MVIRNAFLALMGFIVMSSAATVTPFNSWRILIVYTNYIDYLYGGGTGTVNFHKTYFASLIDGMNQVYEDSEVDARAQLAGVIWDKEFSDMSWYGEYFNYLYNGIGVGRYRDLLDTYAADVILLIHPDTTNAAGAAVTRPSANFYGYASVWLEAPNNLMFFAHEMGHVHSSAGSDDHCEYGHRRVFDEIGSEVGGPLPDTVSFILEDPGGGIPDALVETAVRHAYSGFHTTMAYSSGGGSAGNYPCYPTYTHTYGGIQRTFKFHHQGVSWGQPGGNHWLPEWTGTYSNPEKTWVEPVTSTIYPTGSDTLQYLNRLKYLAESAEAYRDTSTYNRNFSAILNAYADTVRELKGFPSDLTIKADMSLGHNTADSQWVYAHFVATNLVTIEPGFKVTDGTSMRITVSEGESMLARSGHASPGDKNVRGSIQETPSGLDFRYNATTQSIGFTFFSEVPSRVVVSVYDLRGSRKVIRAFSPTMGNSTSGFLSVKDLPAGIYVARFQAGGKQYQRRFLKW